MDTAKNIFTAAGIPANPRDSVSSGICVRFALIM